jgi:hypothetical protein
MSKSYHLNHQFFIMKNNVVNQTPRRRGFLRGIANGAGALGLAAIASSFKIASPSKESGVM